MTLRRNCASTLGIPLLLAFPPALLGSDARAAAGEVLAGQKINLEERGFSGYPNRQARFGVAMTSLGDLDGDGIADCVVGAYGGDNGNEFCDDSERGAGRANGGAAVRGRSCRLKRAE